MLHRGRVQAVNGDNGRQQSDDEFLASIGIQSAPIPSQASAVSAAQSGRSQLEQLISEQRRRNLCYGASGPRAIVDEPSTRKYEVNVDAQALPCVGDVVLLRTVRTDQEFDWLGSIVTIDGAGGFEVRPIGDLAVKSIVPRGQLERGEVIFQGVVNGFHVIDWMLF
jgi:hypothetical protein